MKKLITLYLILSGVIAQAQRAWEPASYETMRKSATITGMPNDAASVQKYLDESMKNCYVYPTNPERNKTGDVTAKKVNIWIPKGSNSGGYLSPWAYIVTVDLIWGNTPSEIEHPDSPVKADPCGAVTDKSGKQPTILVNGNYIAPQSELIKAGKITHKFYRPTYAQYKKLTRAQQDWVDRGGVDIRQNH